MGKHLVLVGGGHAHMMTLAAIRDIQDMGHSVTVIGPSKYHYYSGMGPGMLGESYTPQQIRFATRHVVEKLGGRFILDKVTRVDPVEKKVFLASGDTLSYDVVSFNSGSSIDQQMVVPQSPAVFSVKPIKTLFKAQQKIIAETSTRKITIGIIGGGPSSAEISGNIRQLVHRHHGIQPIIQIFSSGNYMKQFPKKVRHLTKKKLAAKGIDILETSRVQQVNNRQIVLKTGESYPADIIFLAHGVRPSRIFSASNIPVGDDGGLLVNQFLQVTQYPEIFGGGDCISFAPQPLNKVGVYAVRQNPILLHNLVAALEGKPLQPFDPGGDYLLIFNLGQGQGVFHKGMLTFSGRLAFTIKDTIDRKFIRKFQAIEYEQ